MTGFLKWIGKHLGAIIAGILTSSVFIATAIVAVVAVVIGSTGEKVTITDTSTDIYYIAAANVKTELKIENHLHAVLLKVVCAKAGMDLKELAEVESLIKQYFVVDVIPPTELSSPVSDASDTSDTPPVYRFMETYEIHEAIAKEPFLFDSQDIEDVRKISET